MLLGGFIGQILRGKGCARETITAGGGADVEDGIAHALGRAARDLVVAQHAEAESVDQRITFVAFVEINLAPDGGDAKAVSVMCDAIDHSGEEATVVRQRRALRFARGSRVHETLIGSEF